MPRSICASWKANLGVSVVHYFKTFPKQIDEQKTDRSANKHFKTASGGIPEYLFTQNVNSMNVNYFDYLQLIYNNWFMIIA